MLKWRLVSSMVIIPALLGLLALDHRCPLGAPGVWLLPLALLVSATMVHELLGLWHARSDRPLGWPVYLGTLGTVLAAVAFSGWNVDPRPRDLRKRWGDWAVPCWA